MSTTEKMRSRHTLSSLLTLCIVLTWKLGVLAKNIRQDENDYFDSASWSLMPADNEAATSLSDLKTGVYSIQLREKRSGCGLDSKGPGMMMTTIMVATLWLAIDFMIFNTRMTR